MNTSASMIVAAVAAFLLAPPEAPDPVSTVPQAASTAWRDLAPDDTDAESCLALGMWEARRGRARDALRVFDELLESEPEATLAERIATERDRLARWIDLRQDFVDFVIEKGSKITIELDGKKLVTTILARDGDSLALGENRLELEKLSLEAIEPVQIAKCMAKGRPEHKSTWVRVYAYALAGDPRWTKLLRDPSKEAQAFRKDVETAYPDLLMRAEVCAELVAMSVLPAPKTTAQIDAVLQRIESLRKNHGKLRVVEEKAWPLRELARAALEVRFDILGLDGVLNGRVEKLDGNQIKLIYDFKDAKQLDDFQDDPDYLASFRHQAGETHEDTETKFEVKKSVLVGRGSTCLRLPVWFERLDRIRYEFEFRSAPESEGTAMRFMVGFFDDGDGTFASSMGFGDLILRDKKTGRETSSIESATNTFFMRSVYLVEVRNDDDAFLRTALNGDERRELDRGRLDEGYVFLWFHTDLLVAIHELEFEGAVSKTSLETMKKSWTAQQLAKLGMR